MLDLFKDTLITIMINIYLGFIFSNYKLDSQKKLPILIKITNLIKVDWGEICT